MAQVMECVESFAGNGHSVKLGERLPAEHELVQRHPLLHALRQRACPSRPPAGGATGTATARQGAAARAPAPVVLGLEPGVRAG
jgi:hypothetical protein